MAQNLEAAANQRALLEERSHEFQIRMTHTPLQILPRADDSVKDIDRLVIFRDFFTKWKTRKLSNLRVDDCRLFCWKDCAVYRNVHDAGLDNHDILKRVWSEWYPHRAMDKDIDDESFFMKYMVFQEPVKRLEEIVVFHQALCEKLYELVGQIPDTKPESPLTANKRQRRDPLEHAEYRLRATFAEVFIVLENGWREDGVLLVWKSKDAADRHGCHVSEGVRKYTGTLVETASSFDSDLLFHCSLERAMHVITSTDFDRTNTRGRYESRNLTTMYGRE